MSGYLIFVLLGIGLYGLAACRNVVRKVIALAIANAAVVLLFMYTGSLNGGAAPILVTGTGLVVDPVPQALMLTAIVVGVCVTALGLCIVYRLYQHFGTLDITRIERSYNEQNDTQQAQGHEPVTISARSGNP